MKKVTLKDSRIISGGYPELTPKTKDKHVGVELEIVCPMAALRQYVQHYDYTNQPYPLADKLAEAGLVKNVRLTTDGSINTNGGGGGIEIRVLAPETEIKEVIKKVCIILKELKCKVNKSCGLHVHLDMRYRTPKDSFKRLVHKLPDLKKMVKKDRLKNSYCVENYCDDLDLIMEENDDYYDFDTYDFEDKLQRIDRQKPELRKQNLEKAIEEELKILKKHLENKSKVKETDRDRYLAINPHALENHDTIEVRLHEGCIDEEKINKWIDTLVATADGKDVA